MTHRQETSMNERKKYTLTVTNEAGEVLELWLIRALSRKGELW